MTIKKSLKLAFAIALPFLALPLLHAQNETPTQTAVRYQKSCDAGNPPDCIHLADAYVAGTGVPKNQDKANSLIQQAAGLYQKACDGGEATACVNTGDMWMKYAHDNHDAANPLYRKACDGGNATGCYNLAVAYAFGYGFPVDYAQAAAFYQKACDGGHASGCLKAGFMYSLGLDSPVPQDQARANALFRKACDGDHKIATDEQYYGSPDKDIADCCEQLGHAYKFGRGVPIDKAQAAALYRKACALGESDGCDSLKELGQQ
jgi:TPR repeat protein